MRRLVLLLPALLFSEDFISHYDYGSMLYKTPRGVSCAQCHGEYGQGVNIVSFTQKDGTEVTIKGADIREKSLKEMIKSTNSNHQVMPRYYLTDVEVEAIYDYLKKKNSLKAKKVY